MSGIINDPRQLLEEENGTLRLLLADLIHRQPTSPIAHFNAEVLAGLNKPEIEVLWDGTYRTVTARVVQ